MVGDSVGMGGTMDDERGLGGAMGPMEMVGDNGDGAQWGVKGVGDFGDDRKMVEGQHWGDHGG